MAGKSPVSPKKNVYLLAALIIGIAFPVCIIYLMDLMKYKIENRKDVEKLCNLPILAELPLGNIQESVRGAIVIHENKNNLMEEAFRSLRTNLLFMLKPEEKIIMITSSQPSDGKSFVAGNLAVSLAYLGKKVMIIGLDIRKSGLDKVFGLNSHSPGITNYLTQTEHTDFSEWILASGISPNLDIFPRGNIPPNPTELVSRSTLDKLILQLKEKYDYVILDTAPIAMVTDTSIISRVADLCVYVCRADHTPKAAFQFVNTLKEQASFCPIAIVINGIDLQKKKNKLNYSYGYKYGYGHTYGYGYGYGKESGLH
jgi:capsular exopolysaccharide synthesis family protein